MKSIILGKEFWKGVIWKTIFKVFSAICLIAVLVCAVCDFVINRAFTWSGYCALSVVFFWLLTIPPFCVKKRKFLLTLITFTIAAFPFLFLLDCLTPGKTWFMPLGLPIGVLSFIIIWITYVLLRFCKINKWYMTAVVVFLYGVILSTAIRCFVGVFVGHGLFTIYNLINLISNAAIVALFVLLGRKSKSKLEEKPNHKNSI